MCWFILRELEKWFETLITLIDDQFFSLLPSLCTTQLYSLATLMKYDATTHWSQVNENVLLARARNCATMVKVGMVRCRVRNYALTLQIRGPPQKRNFSVWPLRMLDLSHQPGRDAVEMHRLPPPHLQQLEENLLLEKPTIVCQSKWDYQIQKFSALPWRQDLQNIQ